VPGIESGSLACEELPLRQRYFEFLVTNRRRLDPVLDSRGRRGAVHNLPSVHVVVVGLRGSTVTIGDVGWLKQLGLAVARLDPGIPASLRSISTEIETSVASSFF
jgi:hypothetical protein